jgi:hypothetical protein
VTSREQFALLLGTLAVSKQRDIDDETLEVYWADLHSIPFPILQAAIGRLIQAPGGWLPSIGDIRGACDRERPRSSVMLGTDDLRKLLPHVATLPDDDPRTWHACSTCQDTGWAELWCPAPSNTPAPEAHTFVRIEPCGRCRTLGANYPGHVYVQRCVCYATNRVIQERLAKRRKYAAGDAA